MFHEIASFAKKVLLRNSGYLWAVPTNTGVFYARVVSDILIFTTAVSRVLASAVCLMYRAISINVVGSKLKAFKL